MNKQRFYSLMKVVIFANNLFFCNLTYSHLIGFQTINFLLRFSAIFIEAGNTTDEAGK